MMNFVFGCLLGYLFGRFVRWTHRNDWRDDPPTEKQLAYAEELGIRVPKNYTKGQVSDLISAAKGS